MIVLASAVTIDYFLHETTHVHANISSQAELKIDVGPTYSTNMQGVFSSLPIFCFAYQSHMSSVKIYRRIEHPKSYPYITAVAFLITFVLYNVTGVMSLLTFGASIDPEMLNSYSKSDFPILFARTGIVGCIMGAYPVFTLMARDMIRKTENFRFRIMFGIVWFIICAFCAMLIPNFQVASAVIGSMAALLMFVFPGLTLLVSYVERKFYRCILGVFFTVVGVFLFVYSFIAALMA
jgi:amino acid permease